MSDPLNPYPGNLKHHNLMPDDPYLVELRKALGPLDREMDTAKQFLLLAGEKDALLAARAKDGELIQTLVDALDQTRDAFDLYASCRCDGSGCPVCRVMDRADNALFAANQHGFKPSDP